MILDPLICIAKVSTSQHVWGSNLQLHCADCSWTHWSAANAVQYLFKACSGRLEFGWPDFPCPKNSKQLTETSLVLQIFNMLNARKIKHEYNIFNGLWKSRAFLYIFIIIIGLQLIIMLTAVGNFFTVTHQNWVEWLFALAVGFGSLFVALATKAVARSGGFCMPSQDKDTDPTGDMAMAKSALSGTSDDELADDSTDELRGVQVHPGNQDMQVGPSDPRHTDADTARGFSKQTSRTRYGAVAGDDERNTA